MGVEETRLRQASHCDCLHSAWYLISRLLECAPRLIGPHSLMLTSHPLHSCVSRLTTTTNIGERALPNHPASRSCHCRGPLIRGTRMDARSDQREKCGVHVHRWAWERGKCKVHRAAPRTRWQAFVLSIPLICKARQTLPEYLRIGALPVRGGAALHEHFLSASRSANCQRRTQAGALTQHRSISWLAPALDKCALAWPSEMFVTRL